MDKKRNSIIVVIILCFILGIICIFTQRYLYNSKMEESIDGKTANDQLLLNGLGIFSEKYSGEFKVTDVMKMLNTLAKEDLPDLYNNIKRYDDSKLEKYYTDNSTDIRKKIGKSDFKEFNEFAIKVQNSQVDFKDWDTLNIDKESFVNFSDKTGYAYVEYMISFKNDKNVRFSFYLAHKKSKNIPFIVDIIK